MSDIQRRAILAIFAWLSLAAATPLDRDQHQQEIRAQQAIAQAVENLAAVNREQMALAAHSNETEPCWNREDRRDSDLCAQWKAADAAASAAQWTLISSIISAVSLFGVVLAVGLAYHANRIARDTARRQLRAYMTLKHSYYRGVGRQEPTEEGKEPPKPSFSISFINSGATPALNVKSHYRCFVSPLDFCPMPLPSEQIERSLSYMTGPNRENLVKHGELKLSLPQHASMLEGAAWVYMIGALEYSDIFENRYRIDIIQRSRNADHPGMFVSLLERETVLPPSTKRKGARSGALKRLLKF